MNAATTYDLSKQASEIVAQHIGRWQPGYLADDSAAVAALARLRRGAGKEPHQVPDLLGLVDTGQLYGGGEDSRRWPREADLDRAEGAVHVALTLWALHQQSKGTGMHRHDSRERPAGLGAAVRSLMAPDKIDDAVLKRFVRAGTAPHLAGLAQRLREIVLLLRREDIPLDYVLLARQLHLWQLPGGRDRIRRDWGRSFQTAHSLNRRSPDDDPATGSAAPSDHDSLSKDAL